MADNTLGAYNIADLREMARGRLPKSMFEFGLVTPEGYPATIRRRYGIS